MFTADKSEKYAAVGTACGQLSALSRHAMDSFSIFRSRHGSSILSAGKI